MQMLYIRASSNQPKSARSCPPCRSYLVRSGPLMHCSSQMAPPQWLADPSSWSCSRRATLLGTLHSARHVIVCICYFGVALPGHHECDHYVTLSIWVNAEVRCSSKRSIVTECEYNKKNCWACRFSGSMGES